MQAPISAKNTLAATIHKATMISPECGPAGLQIIPCSAAFTVGKDYYIFLCDAGEGNDEVYKIQDLIDDNALIENNPDIYLMIDRLTVDRTPTGISRLTDSVETAFYEGRRYTLPRYYPPLRFPGPKP